MGFRPNKPPENWHQPDRPSVRSVTGPPGRPLSDSATDHPLYHVRLSRQNWTRVLDLIGYRGSKQRKFRTRVRKAIVSELRTTQQWKEDVFVRLYMAEWWQLWLLLAKQAQSRGGKWQPWFEQISEKMTEQLKNKE